MKNFKLKSTILGCILVLFVCVSQVFAYQDNVENSIVSIEPELGNDTGSSVYIGTLPVFNDYARGASKPSSNKNLSDGVKYTFDFDTIGAASVYSSYNFTGVTKMRLFINAASRDSYMSSFDYTVKVYKKGTLSDTCIATYTRNTSTDDNTAMVFTTNSSDKYYFRISTMYSIAGSGYIKKY